MATFKEARKALFHCNSLNLIDDEEFLLLYDANKSKNRDIPYSQYENFDLDSMADDECMSEFRFLKNDIYRLLEVLDLPSKVRCPNRFFVNDVEALCILLKRFAYPCRYVDLSRRFGRLVPQISMVVNETMEIIYDQYNHLLSSFNQPWLSPASLEEFAYVVNQKGGALDNCWGFIDGTVRPVCRPGTHQRVLYNGHKRVHSIKFQSVVAPNGLIANMYGPVEGRRHDSGMLASSGFLQSLSTNSHNTAGQPLCVYGDPAYPLRVHLQGPYKGGNLTAMQEAYNQSMSKVRVAVEWVFNDILNYFAFLDFKKNLKVGLSAIGKVYLVCALLRNARTCLYGSSTTTFFDVDPPSLEQYFT
ncbi:hypothetical protein QZH41_007490 [Actinostola sp. cb2023]|nr:hypothetical protein QZH41_007490 [Actinostola sp. cb2023]